MKYVFWTFVAAMLVVGAWRIVEPNVSNFLLQDDMRDTAAQLGWHTGLTTLNSDGDLRSIIIEKAKRRGITLDPKEITVQRGGTEQYPLWIMAADYRVKVDLFVYSFALRFQPTSKGDGSFWGTIDSEVPQSQAPAVAPPKPEPSNPRETREAPRTPELKKIPESLKHPMPR